MNLTKHFKNVEGINLNSGSVSRCPEVVIAAVKKYLDEYELNPTYALTTTWSRLWPVQKQLGEFFGADPRCLFLRPNITMVLGDIIMGVQLDGPGSIVVSDLEYGAIVNCCRLRAEADKRELKTIELRVGADAYQSSDDLADHILGQIPKDAKMVMLSHVITGTSLVLPIAKIGTELRKRGVSFVVDGAHGPGGVPLDFRELDSVDFYGGNLHKWMMAPKGTAFGWVHPLWHARLRPLFGSWSTGPQIHDWLKGFADGDPFTLKMLHSHTQGFSAYYAIADTLNFWRDVGAENVRRALDGLQNSVIQKVEGEWGWPLLSPRERAIRGPLTTFEMPEKWRKKDGHFGLQLWREIGVQIATPHVKGQAILRVSPHICTEPEQVGQGLDKLKKYFDSH